MAITTKHHRSTKQTVVTGCTAATSTQVPIMGIPFGSVVKIRPTAAGSAKVQYTLSSADEVAAESADWTDWAAGAVAVSTAAALPGAAMAVRCVPTTGIWTLEVVA